MRALACNKPTDGIIGFFVFVTIVTAVFFLVEFGKYFIETSQVSRDTRDFGIAADSPLVAAPTPKNTEKTPKSLVPLAFPFTKSDPRKNGVEWGVYTGWREQDITAFEQIVGRPDIVATFVHFGNENAFPKGTGSLVKGNKQTLAIFWEATDYTVVSASQPKFSCDAILRGDFDSYMKSFAKEAKAYGGPIILIPFSEMNGNWYPWSGTENGNTPEKAVLAYRHVRELFFGVPNVKFGWAVNHESVPDVSENAISEYYPGDAFVHYVGVDGFNFGGEQEQSFNEIFGNALAVLSRYDKPIYIFSVASAEDANKAAWITDAFSVQIPKHQKIAGWIWFNEKKERDWRVDSNPAALSAFKKIIPPQ